MHSPHKGPVMRKFCYVMMPSYQTQGHQYRNECQGISSSCRFLPSPLGPHAIHQTIDIRWQFEWDLGMACQWLQHGGCVKVSNRKGSFKITIQFSMTCLISLLETWWHVYRAESKLEPSQWEMLLQSNSVSHWLGTNPESALRICINELGHHWFK